MDKGYIRTHYGKYCDTDKLVDSMRALLTKYGHKNTEHGVCCVLDEFFKNKKSLIELFMKSKHYIGDLRIALDTEIERRPNATKVSTATYAFYRNIGADDVILKYKDEHGKSIVDHYMRGVKKFKVEDFTPGKPLYEGKCEIDGFTLNGHTMKSQGELDRFYKALNCFSRNWEHLLTQDTVKLLKSKVPECSFAPEMKTSRAFHRLCCNFGVDKSPKYNKEFAAYADVVSGLKRKYKFFISVNPLDYLTMSFGNSWSSCHTIDKKNARGMENGYRGQYCGGTVSYMLDSTSFITYIHKEIPADFEEGKIMRNMFHFDGRAFVQSRVYPQNDSTDEDIRAHFRHIVQAEFSEMLGLSENRWTVTPKIVFLSTGPHYQDYLAYAKTIFYPASFDKPTEPMHIGHNRICFKCGNEFVSNNTGVLTCSNC